MAAPTTPNGSPARHKSRLLANAERIVCAERSSAARVAVTVGGFAAAVVLGVLDYVTGAGLSLSAFYVLAVVAVTVASGLAIGLVAAGFTATVWAVSDALIRKLELSVVDDVWNTAVGFVALATVAVLVAALSRAVAAARASERRSQEFLAVAAHQLRTPLAAVRTTVDALVHTPAGPTHEQLLANVGAEATRVSRLISSLLRMARLDQGEGVRAEPVEVRALLEAEMERMRGLSTLEFQLDVDATVPAVVALDGDATREALANLLDNARRHAVVRVDLHVRCDDDMLTVAVADDGPGLPAGREDAAFDRFVTLDGGTGSGLGLPVARGLARLQGGDVTYAHKRFYLTLPLRPSPPTRPSADGARAPLGTIGPRK